MESIIKASMQQAMKGHATTAKQQAAIDKMTAKMMETMREEMSWEKLEPLYLRIYQKSFTQEEVDGMLAFYKSPVGAAVIKKLPVVMQESTAAMQERLGPLMAKIQSAVKETITELRAEEAKEKSEESKAEEGEKK
jgi:hypothetical protein